MNDTTLTVTDASNCVVGGEITVSSGDTYWSGTITDISSNVITLTTASGNNFNTGSTVHDVKRR